MQRSLILVLTIAYSLFLANPASCQIIDTLYYNKYWQLVAKDSGNYYRIAEVDTTNLWFVGRFTDYFKNGNKFIEGQYSKSGYKNGAFKTYYSKDNLYSEGVFLDDKLFGIWRYYYPSGQLREVIEFTEYDFVIKEYYSEKGEPIIKNGYGKWTFVILTTQGKPFELTGRFTNGMRNGTWTLRNSAGNPVLKEIYLNDQFLDGYAFDEPGSTYSESRFANNLFYPDNLSIIEAFRVWDATKQDYPYISWLVDGGTKSAAPNLNKEKPDEPAYFPLGMNAFYNKIAKVLVYPRAAQLEGITGKVNVEFIVGTDGNLYDLKVVKGIGGGCDQEAIIAVLNAGRWFPAQKNGLPISQKTMITISFRIE